MKESDINTLSKLIAGRSEITLQEISKIYSQLESLSWLQRVLTIKRSLPPLRGWPVSPDFLLRLHTWVRDNQPRVVVELGSGASTIVIADALKQNGIGKLYSFEHLNKYALQTLHMLELENLSRWVDLRIGALELWHGKHLNQSDAKKPSRWYPVNFEGIDEIELVIVDGPPGSTCSYARYPALPALINRLALNSEIWMDDANRNEDKIICEKWAEDYNFELEFILLEKGLGRLSRPKYSKKTSQLDSSNQSEKVLGLDFSIGDGF